MSFILEWLDLPFALAHDDRMHFWVSCAAASNISMVNADALSPKY